VKQSLSPIKKKNPQNRTTKSMDVSNHKAMGNRSSFDETWQPMARFNLGVSTAKNGRKNLTVLKPRFLWKDAFCFSLLGGKGKPR